MNQRLRLIGILVATVLATLLGVVAIWPIYQHAWVILVAGVGWLLGAGVSSLAARRRWSIPVLLLVLFAAFTITVVPVAVPHAFDQLPFGPLRGLRDGLAGIILGWKQLLTLTLPVGVYQAVLVPAYLVFLLSTCVATYLVLRSERFAPLASIPLVLPVLFGTVFGAAEVSVSLQFGSLLVMAPRELLLWLGAAMLGAVWVWLSAGAARREALYRGRVGADSRLASGRFWRAGIGAVTVVFAIFAGVVLAPLINSDERHVPRDRLDPEVVLRERPSPLAVYRVWKRDAALDVPVFSVRAEGKLPSRLRLAVLDEYDGVDFYVGSAQAGSFTRFPSGDRVESPSNVMLTIAAGYGDIWVPTAPLGSVPSFTGSRAAELADSFYVNRATGAAIAVPGGADTAGLIPGDGFQAVMSAEPDAVPSGNPISGAMIDLDAMPELATWLRKQDQPANAHGLIELIDRLRARGYLSHSMTESEGERLWLERLSEEYGTRFESSAGGHSLARIEQLFSKLNTQERLAGQEPSAEMLVAGVGNDEQFAAAAALIARALGFESRVVLGVRLGDEHAGVPGVPACQAVCTGEHLAAWVEVRGQDGVWGVLDVTPQLVLRPTALEEGERLPEFATIPEERDAQDIDPPIGFGERSDYAEDTSDSGLSSWLIPVLRTTGLSISALALLLVPLLFLPLAKRLREKSRRSEVDPELSALGAWQQMVDSAIDAGVDIPSGASRSEIAQLLGTKPAIWAADTVTKAVFSAQALPEQEAEWMWAAVDADRTERLAQRGWWQRLCSRYSLRSYGVKIIKWPGRNSQPRAKLGKKM